MRKQLFKPLLLALPVALWSLGAHGANYTNNLNADPSAEISIRAPSVWRAAGSHDGSGYISITDDVGGAQGAIVLPDLDPDGLGGSLPVSAFTFKAKVRIGGGTARPADGFSINWVEASDPLVGAGTIGEEGATTGLVISLDTWDNRDGGVPLSGDGPAMDIKMNNTIIHHKRFAGDGSAGFYCSPVERDAAGAPISLETDAAGTADPGTFVDIEVRLSKCGALTVVYKGIEIYKDVATGYAPRAGRFVIGARTGGATDNHWIDDIIVNTDTSDATPRVQHPVQPASASGRDLPENSVIQYIIDGSGSFEQVDQASIRLTVNGTDVTSAAGTTIVNDPPPAATTTVTYTSPTNYAPGQRVEAVLTYRDLGANPHVCTARKVFWVTPVVAQGFNGQTLFIEAEDFNYTNDVNGAGQFFDFGSPAGSYNTLAAAHDIDYHLNASNADSPVYRTLTPPNGIVGIGDNNRAGTVHTPDYKLGWNDSGDWYNYTRTFPNNTYKIYGRFSSGGANTAASLDRVTSDPKVGNQTVQPLGQFLGDTTGGWDSFCFIPLRDPSGNELVTRLNGLTTLRITVLPGNYDFNYLAFVPTFTPTIRPAVVSTEPTGQSLRAPRLRAVISNRDTAVNTSTIRLFIDGNEATGLTVTPSADGATVEYQVTTNMVVDSAHTATIIFADNDATTPVSVTNSWNFTVGPLKGGGQTLFIEAEDFNYSEDGVAGGLHANFGDPDCSLLGKNGVRGVDYSQGSGNDPGAVPAYRAPTDVEAAKPGTDGFQRADRTITCSYIVGWNDPGDWQNYTRNWGTTTNRYNVYARMSSGGAAESADFSRVTSDPTQPNQTLESVGQFNSPATGNWDIFHFVPLRDGGGNLVSLRLGGTNTFRLSHLPGNFDINYIAFVLDDIPFYTPAIASVEPRDDSSYARAPLVKVVIRDEDSKVVANSIKLFINGSEVTSTATITDTATGAEITWQAPNVPAGTAYSARVEWRDDQATPAAGQFEWNWTSGIYNAEQNLFIELEDFNTGGGTFIPSSAGHPFNEKGQYNGLSGTTGTDFSDSGNADAVSDVYRLGEAPNVGMATLNDSYRAGAGPRPGFETVSDYKVGWTDSGFPDWYNYTRDFGPGGTYNVYLRVSHGDAAQTMGGRLDLLNDPAVPDPGQTVNLGNFRGPATGGWDTFTFLPMMKDGSQAVVGLTNVQTLRYTVEAGGGDVNYLMFVPAAPIAPPLTISRSGNNIVVTWSQGRLQSTSSLSPANWQDVTGATSPHQFANPGTGMQFFRTINP